MRARNWGWSSKLVIKFMTLAIIQIGCILHNSMVMRRNPVLTFMKSCHKHYNGHSYHYNSHVKIISKQDMQHFVNFMTQLLAPISRPPYFWNGMLSIPTADF